MGFFSRNKERLQMARVGVEALRERDEGLPPRSAGPEARREAIMARQEAKLAEAEQRGRILGEGIDTPATVQTVEFHKRATYTEATVDVTVEPWTGEPYPARIVTPAAGTLTPSLVVGARCTVRVDPQDAQEMLLWNIGPDWTPPEPPGAAPAPLSAPAPATAVERIAKLAELHAAGLITDEEFATRKAQVIASS